MWQNLVISRSKYNKLKLEQAQGSRQNVIKTTRLIWAAGCWRTFLWKLLFKEKMLMTEFQLRQTLKGCLCTMPVLGSSFHFSSSPEIFPSMLLKVLTKQSVGGGLEHKKLMKWKQEASKYCRMRFTMICTIDHMSRWAYCNMNRFPIAM